MHNIISFEIRKRKNFEILNELNMPFSYFQVDNINKPEIIFNIGEFTPQKEKSHVVNHSIFIKEDYIYCQQFSDKIRFEFEIIDITKTPTIVNINTKSNKVKHKLLNAVIEQLAILRTLIDLKLLFKGFISIHAAGIANQGKAIIFPGRGGTFKTTLCMDFIRNKGFSFLGDDRVILKDNKVFSYPLFFKLFDYRVKNMKTEDYKWLSKYNFLFYLLKNYNLKTPSYIEDNSKLSSIYFITKSDNKDITTRSLSKKEISKKIMNSQKMEDLISSQFMGFQTGLIHECLLAYSYIYPDDKIANLWDTYCDLLDKYIFEKTFLEIILPNQYSSKTFQNFFELINGNDLI